jgi:cation diffusion facilitator CzcD-associated flavoprotein CzcO
MQRMSARYCIIGAGYAGNGVAKAFSDAGLPYDHLEATDHVGGNWAHGVYDSTHIISSRDSTQYEGFPMPPEFPDFPSRDQVCAYLNAFVDHFGLRENIEFGAEVVRVEPLDRTGMAGWRVELAGGEVRHYTGVVVCNGHHWKGFVPEYPGEFTGQELHSKEYFRPADVTGDRVLVVGAGNSACDVAVELAGVLGGCDISMRRGNWFFPKTMFGIPTAEFDRSWVPTFAQRAFAGAYIRMRFGPWSRYGLPEPDYRPFDKHPIVNEQALYYLRHGRLVRRPGIERLDGSTVHFTDGTASEYDAIVWATGFEISFPFLDESLFEWREGVPARTAGMLPPGMANLYIFGLSQPRGGAGPLITRGSALLAQMVRTQEQISFPLSKAFERLRKPDSRMLFGVSETMRLIRQGHFALGLIKRHATLTRRRRSGPPTLPPVPVSTPATREPAAVR